MTGAVALPGSVEALDADWFTQALAERFPGTVVTKATRGAVIHGTATKVRVLLDYNEAGHAHRLPPTLWFKGGLEAHSASVTMLSVYAAETAFYRDFAPGLSLSLPRCYFAHFDAATGRSALLLEDMLARNVRFGDTRRPASPRLAANVLGQLARLHAAFRASDLAATPLLVEGGTRLAAFVREHNLSAENWRRCLALPRGRLVTGPLADQDLMAELMQRMLADDRARADGLVHGDLHLGNVCVFPDEEACFLDWQAVMLGFWAHDVGYFLPAALTIADRRAHERALVAHYVAEFRRAGGTLDAEEAWWEYRRHALYGACWFGCPPEWVPEEVALRNTERVAAAMEDLGTIDCWCRDATPKV